MRYRAKRGQSVPMPDRPGENMPHEGDGVLIDTMNPYYARLVADGDVVAVPDEVAETPAGKPSERKP